MFPGCFFGGSLGDFNGDAGTGETVFSPSESPSESPSSDSNSSSYVTAGAPRSGLVWSTNLFGKLFVISASTFVAIVSADSPRSGFAEQNPLSIPLKTLATIEPAASRLYPPSCTKTVATPQPAMSAPIFS